MHQTTIETADRACPVCEAPAGVGRVLHDECFDSVGLGPFAFAPRKLPELMHWRLVECPVCDVLFASPAPTAGVLATAYRDTAYQSEEESRYAARTHHDLLRDAVPALPPTGGALDVGTGDGAFLRSLMDLGFDDVAGVEPSLAAIETADRDIRALIRADEFHAEDFEPQRYRLISALHIVEHLADPLEAFRGAHGLLGDGGAMLVVCHDRRAALNRLLGSRSPIYDIEHLQLFCRRSLRALLARAGFRDVRIWRFRNRYPLRYWLRLAPLGRTKAGVATALERVRLGSLPLTLPVGNLAAVAWKDATTDP